MRSPSKGLADDFCSCDVFDISIIKFISYHCRSNELGMRWSERVQTEVRVKKQP
jgi:hypothetical protein